MPGEPFYAKLVADNGSDEYAKTDIELSKKLLADAGIDTATPIDVRLLFADQNPRRASEYELIRDSVAKAGFNLVDGRGHQLEPEPAEHDAVRRRPLRVADDGGRGRRLDAELRHRRRQQLLRLQQPQGRRAERPS